MVCGLATLNQQHFTVKHMLRLTQVHVEIVTFLFYSVILGFQAFLHHRVAAMCGGSDPIKASVYPVKPYKVKVNLRVVCLLCCRAELASLVRYCLKTRLFAFFLFFFFCGCRVRPNGVLQRERDSGDQRGWWAKFLRSPRHCAHSTANRVSDFCDVKHNGPTSKSFLLAALIEVLKQILSILCSVPILLHWCKPDHWQKPCCLFFFFPCRDVFPQGLPDEYAFVTTFKFRKTSRREDWYLWQVFDKYGIPQVGRPTANSNRFDVC